ncbi:MAG: metallophosphoesterase [Candidatus Cryptobacteroides sp.]
MDRRHFIGGLVAAGTLAAIGKADAAGLFETAGKKSSRPSARFDENLAVILSDLHCKEDSYMLDRLRIIVNDIISMKPRPANVIVLGDLAHLTGKLSDYRTLLGPLQEIEDAGIKLTLTMGNHDRREEFAKVFPSQVESSMVRGRVTRLVETPRVNIVLLDSLNQSDDEKVFINSGILNDAQTGWLRETLSASDKPVLVCAHHPVGEVGIAGLLLDSPACCGYIHGHDHLGKKNVIKKNYTDRILLRTLCVPSTGYWGDIGYVTLRMEEDRAVATLREKEYFFPAPVAEGEEVPAQWKEIAKDQDGSVCTFMYRR